MDTEGIQNAVGRTTSSSEKLMDFVADLEILRSKVCVGVWVNQELEKRVHKHKQKLEDLKGNNSASTNSSAIPEDDVESSHFVDLKKQAPSESLITAASDQHNAYLSKCGEVMFAREEATYGLVPIQTIDKGMFLWHKVLKYGKLAQGCVAARSENIVIGGSRNAFHINLPSPTWTHKIKSRTTSCDFLTQLVALGDPEGKLRLWNISNGKLDTLLDTHKDYVTCVRGHPQARHIISTSLDGTLVCSDVEKSTKAAIYVWEDTQIMSAGMNPAGCNVVIIMKNAVSNIVIQDLRQPQMPGFSVACDSPFQVYFLNENDILTTSHHNITVYDQRMLINRKATIHFPNSTLRHVAVDPKTRFIASCSSDGISVLKTNYGLVEVYCASDVKDAVGITFGKKSNNLVAITDKHILQLDWAIQNI